MKSFPYEAMHDGHKWTGSDESPHLKRLMFTTKTDNDFAIFYSSDGGWGALKQEISGILSEQGIPVLGVNTFTYFWRKRSVDQYAAELDAIITQYRNEWGERRVVLIGFSFGANVLPWIINNLTHKSRGYITQSVMLDPTKDVFFEIELDHYMEASWWGT